MNNARRKEIAEIVTIIRGAHNRLTEVMEAEQEAFDNLPEGFQASERGENMEEAISTMEEAMNDIEMAVDSIEML